MSKIVPRTAANAFNDPATVSSMDGDGSWYGGWGLGIMAIGQPLGRCPHNKHVNGRFQDSVDLITKVGECNCKSSVPRVKCLVAPHSSRRPPVSTARG